MIFPNKAAAIAYAEAHMEVKTATKNGAYTCGRTIRPVGSVDHSTGCAQPNADVFFNNMNQTTAKWGVNFILGDFHKGEGRIIQALRHDPAKKRCSRNWGVGSGKRGSWNDTYIQWEICEPSGHTYAGGTMIGYNVAKNQGYFDRMWKLVVAFNVYICDAYGISADKVADHYESYLAGMGSGHVDVHHWWPKHGKSMDALRAEVAAILNAPTETIQVNYQGEVTADPVLRCRTAPGTAHDIVRLYPLGTVLTITRESQGWGYTGEGWVSLDYIKKITTKVEKEEPEMGLTLQEVDARISEALRNYEAGKCYATLEDVPKDYRPTVQKLMDAKVLTGYNGGADGNLATTADNTILVDETFCRIVTVLDRAGVLNV